MASGWLPLESNPDLLNSFCEKMGVSKTVCSWGDVYGTDETMLSWVPQPVLAVVLLYPITKNNSTFKKKQFESIRENGQKISETLYYLTQLDGLGNACGTIATIHALANNLNSLKLGEKSPLVEFVRSTSKMTPRERGMALVDAKGIREVSESTAQSEEASTKCPDRSARVDAHFVSFVLGDGDTLYELDGRKAFPINHGPSSRKTLLSDTAKVVRSKFMDLDPDNAHFNLMALSLKSP